MTKNSPVGYSNTSDPTVTRTDLEIQLDTHDVHHRPHLVVGHSIHSPYVFVAGIETDLVTMDPSVSFVEGDTRSQLTS